MGFQFLLTILFSILTLASEAAVTRDSLGYQSAAHSAGDSYFVAKLAEGHARALVAKAQDLYNRQSKLFRSGAGSSFELSNAAIALINAKFSQAQNLMAMKEAEVQTKINLQNMEAEEANSAPNVVQLAKWYVQLRQDRVTLMKTLVDDAKRLADEVTFQFRNTEIIYRKGALAYEEYYNMRVNYQEAIELVKDAEEQVGVAKKQLTAAEGSLNKATNAKAK